MNVRTCASWGLGVTAILLSPILVIFSIPIAIGIGFDIFDLAGEAPFALVLCSPLAFVFLRRVPLRRAAALLRLRHSAKVNYAPKAISGASVRRL
jgi:hypothetical protein